MNDEIERLRHAATAALLSPPRRAHRGERVLHLRPGLARGVRGADPARRYKGTEIPLEFAMQRLVDIQYQRNQVSRARGTFRVQGDTLEVFPPYEQIGYRIEWWGDTVAADHAVRPADRRDRRTSSPRPRSSRPRTTWRRDERMKRALVTIEEELHERLARARVDRASCWRPSGCGCARPTTWR